MEVFKYTERVVNMARPRKLLMMAIGELGVVSRDLIIRTSTDWLATMQRCGSSCQDESTAISSIQSGAGSAGEGGGAKGSHQTVRR